MRRPAPGQLQRCQLCSSATGAMNRRKTKRPITDYLAGRRVASAQESYRSRLRPSTPKVRTASHCKCSKKRIVHRPVASSSLRLSPVANSTVLLIVARANCSKYAATKVTCTSSRNKNVKYRLSHCNESNYPAKKTARYILNCAA